jgi:hypothetical protein
MAILSCIGIWPRANQWEIADVNVLVAIQVELEYQTQTAPSEENTRRLANCVEAITAWGTGVDIWVARDEHSLAFAVGPRFVTESDWDLCLDEIISENSYILSDERADADLTEPEPFERIIEELKRSDLLVAGDDGLLYDSFASETEFSDRVVRAIEEWDSDQEV